MADNDNTPPGVTAHASPVPDQLWAGLRQIAPAAATFALGKGWIDNEMLILLTALAGVIWPIVAGQLKTRRRALELAQVAGSREVPSHIARLRD